MNRIVLDLDDILCDFVASWCKWLKATGMIEEDITIADIKTYDHFMLFGEAAHDFYAKNPEQTYTEWVNPIKGSHEFVEWCHNNFDDVMVLSYARHKNSQDAKTAFVRKHFNIKNIKFSNSKIEKYTFTKDSILIDDYPHNVLQHVKYNDSYGICLNHGGHNPWSNTDHHKGIIQELNISLDKYITTSSYEETKNILMELK